MALQSGLVCPRFGLAVSTAMHAPGHEEKCFPSNRVMVTITGKPFKERVNRIFYIYIASAVHAVCCLLCSICLMVFTSLSVSWKSS